MNPFPRAQFKALVASICNLPPAYVTWQGEADSSPLKPDPAFLWASISMGTAHRNNVAFDELRRTDNADGSFSTLQIGRRQMVMSFRCQTFGSYDQIIAEDVLDLLQTRLASPVNLDALNGMALVYEESGRILTLPNYTNSRAISTAHLELTLALAVRDVAFYPGPNKSIGEVLGTGTTATEAGGAVVQTIDVKENVHP